MRRAFVVMVKRTLAYSAPAGRSLALALGLMLASAFAAAPARGQTFRGSIVGTVADQTQAPVAGAKVTVKNEGTGLTRAAVTGDTGDYALPELPIGVYTVTVDEQGFASLTQSGIAVSVDSEVRVDMTLTPAKVQSTVQVTAQAPLVQSTTDVLGGTISAAQIKNLPVNGRDYTKLIFLNPGVSGSPDQITDSPGSFGEFSVNGARGRANNFLLDGTDMNDGYRNDPAINQAGVFGTPATILPVDAIAELAVLSNFMPEYGRNAGAVINIVTKSGTNQFHGTALEYLRNDALDARNFFDPAPVPKSAFRNNQFGGSLGGPIIKDKTFFFADYEGQREVGGESTTACVPQLNVPGAGAPPINSVIAKLLLRNPWPAANLQPIGSCPNLSATTDFSNSVDSVIGKIDHNINDRNLLTGRYYFGNSFQSFPLGLGHSGNLPGFNTVTPTRVNLVSLSYLTTLGPTQINEVRAGYNRFAEQFYPQDHSFDPSTIGLDTGVGAQDFGLPKITVGSFTPIGGNTSLPRGRTDTNWQFIDDFSWTLGQHGVKLGYEFRRTSVSQIFDESFRGSLSFASVASFLAGTPSGGSQSTGDSNRNTFQNSHALYAQDIFRATRQLTLNFGLRWDYFGVIAEKHNLFSNFDPATGMLELVGVAGNTTSPSIPSLYNPDYRNFAPRFSLAYDVFGKGTTVIRAGWAVFYDVFSQDFFLGHIPYNSSNPGPAYNNIGPQPILSNGGVTSLIAGGQPVFTNFGGTSNVFAADRNIRTPYMYNYNFNIQQQLGKLAALQIGYVGSSGHKLFRFRDINQPENPTQFPDVRPYPSFGYINYEEASAHSNYNSLQLSLRMHTIRGFNSIVNYNWSHSLDNASDGEDFEPNASQPQNSYNPNGEYSNSNFDVRQRFTWVAGYTLPTLNKNYPRLTGGWGVDSALTLQTGQPFQLNFNFSGDYDGTGEFFPRPDVIGDPYSGTSSPNNFINLSAFKVPCTFSNGSCVPGTQHFGDEGRTSLFGPDFKQLDFALYKDTPITERLNLQIRAEAFNFLNHPNFANPFLPSFFAACDFNGGIGTGGINANSGVCQGFLPLQATGDVGVGNPFLGGGGPRGIQLAAKLSF